MSLRIYNTLTKREEEFVPLDDKHVRMYNCGPTVYDYFHIGNARNFVTAEVIRRYLEYKGYRVTFVQNVTDIEDKIIKRANEMGISPAEVAERFTSAYFEDIRRLGIREPDLSPKATEHIDDIIEFVQKLIEKGLAYQVGGDVYYDLMKFKEYGKLSGQKLDDIMLGARVEIDERKKHPADFSLWKESKPGEPGWDSPWGKGRPGWHIECSVMSSKYLGETFDIHSGGNDLIFPHHENEIAQSEGLTGKRLARYWVHNGMLQVTGGKMSKSLGNIKSVRDLLRVYDPETIKFYLLSAHYRAPMELRDDSLDEAKSGVERIRNCISLTGRLGMPNAEVASDRLSEIEKALNDKIDETFQKFEQSMDDDFNTPGAMGAIFELIADVNKFVSEDENLSAESKALLGRAHSAIINLCGVLGLDFTRDMRRTEDRSLAEDLIELIIDIRREARERKDWKTADKIRERLADLGIKLEDTREGTIWKLR